MSEKAKINIQFTLELPILYNEAGHRLSPTELVAPFVDEYFNDLRYAMVFCKEAIPRYVNPNEVDLFEGKEDFYEIYLDDARMKKIFDERELAHQCWLARQEEECQRLYKMSWKEFSALNWQDQLRIKKDENVVWKDGKWVKEELSSAPDSNQT